MIFRWVLNPWAWSNTGLIINKFYSKYEIFVHMHHISVQILYMKLDEMNSEQIKYISTDRFSVDQTQRNNANLNKEIFITVWEYGLILKQRKKLSYYFYPMLTKIIQFYFPLLNFYFPSLKSLKASLQGNKIIRNIYFGYFISMG